MRRLRIGVITSAFVHSIRFGLKLIRRSIEVETELVGSGHTTPTARSAKPRTCRKPSDFFSLGFTHG
jgi:hypothetical protein